MIARLSHTLLPLLLLLRGSAAFTVEGISRRDAFATAFGLSSIVYGSQKVCAASGAPTQAELDRIKEGYRQIVYLLDNFESETTTCRENGGECKRDAEPIRKVLGLRSTTDPLFQIEKVFNKVKYLDLDPDKLDAFFEASEDWNSAMNMSNSMAFISQFGVSFLLLLTL